jgi:hypothetical protein
MIKQFACTFALILGGLSSVTGQQVWPGDINNNGVVNEVDMLYWGLAYESTGPARDEEGVDWQPYDLPTPWGPTLPNGNDFAYADCDGNGEVEDADYETAIEDNFGLTHGAQQSDNYSNAIAGSTAPKLILQPSATVVEEGAMVDITLSLDDSSMPLDDFYGIALSLSYSTELLEGDDGPEFELASNVWIDPTGDQVEDLYVETGVNGRAGLAITRTDQMSVAAQTTAIGNFSIVIEDIIVGLEIDTFFLTIDSIKLVTPNWVTIPVVPDTAQIIVAKDKTIVGVGTRAQQMEPRVQVYPNPADQEVFIRTNVKMENPFLVDPLGRRQPLAIIEVDRQIFRFSSADLPPGLYTVGGYTSEGTWTQQLIIFH